MKISRLRLTVASALIVLALTLPARHAAAQETPPVTALDIFFACRHSDAFVPNTPLQRFCSLRLPTGRASTGDVVSQWIEVAQLTPPALIDYRRKVQDLQQDRRRVAASGHRVRSSDIARGELVFYEDAAIHEGVAEILAGRIRSELARLHDSLGIREAHVVGYYLSRQSLNVADARAKAVRGALRPPPLNQNPGLDSNGVQLAVHGAVPLPTDLNVIPLTEQTADSSFHGRVTIHVQLPVISANNTTVLGVVRFPPGNSDLDESGRILVASAAGQLAGSVTYRNGAIVEVVGHPDTRGANSLAGARAEALKAALVEAGIRPEQIRTETSLVPQEQGGEADSRRWSGGDWFTIRGDAPGAALVPASSTPNSSGLGLTLGWEAVAQAATNAIVARAERDLQQYMLVGFGRRICKVASTTLRDTCLALRDSTSERYLPSLETLRTLVRQDVEWLPERGVTLLLQSVRSDRPAVEARLSELQAEVDAAARLGGAAIPGGGVRGGGDERASRGTPGVATPELAELRKQLSTSREALALELAREAAARPYATRAVIALFAFESARRIHRGNAPLDVLIGFDDWLGSFLERQPGIAYVAEMPAVQSMQRLSRYAGATRDAVEYLRPAAAGGIPRDTVFRYAALQVIANVSEQEREVFAAQFAQVLEARREVEALLISLDSLRQRIAGLQAYGESTREARRELYASALENVVRVGAVGFLNGTMGADREQLERVRETVASLVFATRTRSYPAVLQHSMSLLQDVFPTSGAPCELLGCSPTLLNAQVRALTLAVDVSEAATEQELRSAMTRFVDQGGGVAAKRAGRPRVGLHLNSYVGMGVGWREGGETGFLLRVPVGAEVVFRRPAASWVFSTFLQLVDLGGFLPQQGDSADRSSDERLASVLNPGAFGMLSLGASPVSVGAGLTGDPQIVNDRWKVSPRGVFFIAVDVPLLRLR